MCMCCAGSLPGKPAHLHGYASPAHLDHHILRRNDDIANNRVGRAVVDWLDLVAERNIGECHFHNVGCKPSPRAGGRKLLTYTL